jgi:carbon-monoxide dehydrogenase medium subunit
MEFHSPTSLDEALQLLATVEARPLAGGQSLVAMMNLELVAPARLVSLRRIAELHGIAMQPDGGARIGAMTTHAELAAWHPPAAGPRLLALAARVVAYPAVRNFGTLGGAVAHADPAADYPAALIAAEARIEIASRSGRREISARDFFRGLFETAAQQGEIVTAVHVPAGPAGAGAHYEKLSLVAGDFAIASVAAIVARAGERCTEARIAVGACGPRPVRVLAAEQALANRALDDSTIERAGAALAAACDPGDDQRASAAYRRRIVPELVRRAVRGATR